MFHSNHKCINLKWIIFIIKYTKLQFLGLQQKVFYCSIAFYCLEIKKKEKKALHHFLLYVNTINKNDDKGDRWSLYIRIWIDIIQYKNVRKKGKKNNVRITCSCNKKGVIYFYTSQSGEKW